VPRPPPGTGGTRGGYQVFFKSRLKILKINVRLKIKNQTLIDSDYIFKQGNDRDENF
jgi:hypothetical protein